MTELEKFSISLTIILNLIFILLNIIYYIKYSKTEINKLFGYWTICGDKYSHVFVPTIFLAIIDIALLLVFLSNKLSEYLW